MKFSIVIPQLFYDLIARILPGFFFLILMLLNFPWLIRYLSPLVVTDGGNLVDSLRQVFSYTAFCYLFGWLFFVFTWGSKREVMRKKYEKNSDSKSLNAKYQWIRLSHPAAGFRIVKLRAEARMFEATRTAMLALIIITMVYFLVLFILLSLSKYTVDKALWIRPSIGVLISAISLYGSYKLEVKAWDYYWANIYSIYDILHDPKDPVKMLVEG